MLKESLGGNRSIGVRVCGASVGISDNDDEVDDVTKAKLKHALLPVYDRSKTVMIATISPSAMHYEQTLSTLKYIERAKKIVNKASVQPSGGFINGLSV